MGTLQNRLIWVFQTIASACEGLDAQLVISLGGSAIRIAAKLARKSFSSWVCTSIRTAWKANSWLLMQAWIRRWNVKNGTDGGDPGCQWPAGVAARIAWTGAVSLSPQQIECSEVARRYKAGVDRRILQAECAQITSTPPCWWSDSRRRYYRTGDIHSSSNTAIV